jgi:hypothetical protein
LRAIAFFLPTAGAAAAAPRLAPDRLGPLRFGMTAEDMTTALGQPVTRQPGAYGCSTFTVPGIEEDAQLLAIRGPRLQLVMVYARGIPTTRDVRVGDSLRKLRGRYGSRLKPAAAGNSLSAADAYYSVTRRRGRATYVLRFTVFNSRVSFMDAGRRSDVLGFGECA